MKKIYYTVTPDISEGFLMDTKIVIVYEVVDNEVKPLVELDLLIEECSVSGIEGWLSDNGMGDVEYSFVYL